MKKGQNDQPFAIERQRIVESKLFNTGCQPNEPQELEKEACTRSIETSLDQVISGQEGQKIILDQAYDEEKIGKYSSFSQPEK